MASLTQWTLSLSKLWKTVKGRGAWHAAFCVVAKSWTRVNNNSNNQILSLGLAEDYKEQQKDSEVTE